MNVSAIEIMRVPYQEFEEIALAALEKRFGQLIAMKKMTEHDARERIEGYLYGERPGDVANQIARERAEFRLKHII